MPHNITLLSPSQRFRLVPPTAEDDEAVSIIRSHPSTLRYLRFFPKHVTVDEIRVRRETRAEDPKLLDFLIHFKNPDGSIKFAGTTGTFNIDNVHGSCEMGILISPDMHRLGLGSETLYTLLKYVFEEQKLHRVTFETAEDNAPMRGWLDMVGATLEAKRRDCWREVGPAVKYTTVMGYSILEHEWEGVKDILERSFSTKATPTAS